MQDNQYALIKIGVKIGYICVFLALMGFAYSIFIHPYIYVWHQTLEGCAELARAESNRQIVTCEANAKRDSSKALAEAEIIRAEGVAQANKIIGNSLQNNDGYLKYLWIQGMQTNRMQVVYVPTEANLPILESQRWNQNMRHVE
jgi:hypothetical protein